MLYISTSNLSEQGVVDVSRNTNQAINGDELGIYEEALEKNPNSYDEFIRTVEDIAQTETGTYNSCTIEFDVFSKSFVNIFKLLSEGEEEEFEETYQDKVSSTTGELLESYFPGEVDRLTEIGKEIDGRYSFKDGYTDDNDGIERSDGAVVFN